MPDTEKLIDECVAEFLQWKDDPDRHGRTAFDILREFAAAVWEAKVRDAIDAQTEPPDPDDLVRNPDGTILTIPLSHDSRLNIDPQEELEVDP